MSSGDSSKKNQQLLIFGTVAVGAVASYFIWKKLSSTSGSEQIQTTRPRDTPTSSQQQTAARDETLATVSSTTKTTTAAGTSSSFLQEPSTMSTSALSELNATEETNSEEQQRQQQQLEARRKEEEEREAKMKLLRIQEHTREHEFQSRESLSQQRDDEYQELEGMELEHRYLAQQTSSIVQRQGESKERLEELRVSVEREQEEEDREEAEAAEVAQLVQVSQKLANAEQESAIEPNSNDNKLDDDEDAGEEIISEAGEQELEDKKVKEEEEKTTTIPAVLPKLSFKDTLKQPATTGAPGSAALSARKNLFAEITPRSSRRNRSNSIQFVTPRKLTARGADSGNIMSVLGLEIPTNSTALTRCYTIAASPGTVNPISHFPVSQSRYTVAGVKKDFAAELVLMAEDLTLSQAISCDDAREGAVSGSADDGSGGAQKDLSSSSSSKSYMARSLDALFSMQEIDQKRLRLLNKEEDSDVLVKSTFESYCDLSIEARPDVGVETTVYNANLYKVVGSTVGYTFQLMCPKGCQEEAMKLFLALAGEATVDLAVTKGSSLEGSLRYHHILPPTPRNGRGENLNSGSVVFEMPLQYSVVVNNSVTTDDEGADEGANFQSRLDPSLDGVVIPAHRVKESDIKQEQQSPENKDGSPVPILDVPGFDLLLKGASTQAIEGFKVYPIPTASSGPGDAAGTSTADGDGESSEGGASSPGRLTMTSSSTFHVDNKSPTGANGSSGSESGIEQQEGSAAYYVCPVATFPLPTTGRPFIIEHKFGEALLSMYVECNVPIPRSPNAPPFPPLDDLVAAAADNNNNNSKVVDTTLMKSFAELTVGFAFGSEVAINERFQSEIIHSPMWTSGFQRLPDREFPELAVDSIVIANAMVLVGRSKVLGDEMTLHFFALETMEDEWLVLKWTIPTNCVEFDAIKEYADTLPDRLRLF